MIRTGEVVVVPIRRTWIRCGMSEPVTKTSRSETFSSCFELWPTGVPASEEVMDKRNRVALTENITAFTTVKIHRAGFIRNFDRPAKLHVPCCRGGRQPHYEFNRSTEFTVG